MPPRLIPRKQHRKLPFLKTFARIGTISGAAKASRISRDAVYDWLTDDPAFHRAFEYAKTLRPRLIAELAISLSNIERTFREDDIRLGVVPSGELAELPLSPERFEDVAIPNCDQGSSASI